MRIRFNSAVLTSTAALTLAIAIMLSVVDDAVAQAIDPKATSPVTRPLTPSKTGARAEDATLMSQVKMALLNAVDITSRQIDIEVFEGQIQLLGFVATEQEKAAAERIAGGVAGVRNVRNSLEVQPADRDANQMLADSVITARVQAALVGDSRTKAQPIDVTTQRGVVRLGGFVDNGKTKATAAQLARSITGVKSVQNQLAVKDAPPPARPRQQ